MKYFSLLGLAYVTVFLSSGIFADASTTTSTGSGEPPPPPMEPVTQSSIVPNRDALTTAILANVQTKISQDPTFAGTTISVTSQPGVVIILDGMANSQAQINAAINAAKSIPGVIDVKSNLTINGGAATTTGTNGSAATTTAAPSY